MKNKNILQFTPYYPPHIGGVEIVTQGIAEKWVYYNSGNSYVITSDINLIISKNIEKIFFEDLEIGFIENGVEIFLVPSFELINNFPVYNIFSKKYKKILTYIKKKNENITVITHTRFFLSAFFGAIFAKKYDYYHIHIEHGSFFVKTGKNIIDACSKLYDISLGKYTLKKADTVLTISNASGKFIMENFGIDATETWYRGMNIPQNNIEKNGDICFVFIGRLTGLKNVSSLIENYKKGNFIEKLYIIGDGEEKLNLKKQVVGKNIEFLSSIENRKIIDFLQRNKCILINPSSQEGLPTTIIEGLITKNIVIATDVGGTSEISSGKDLILYQLGDTELLIEKMDYALNNFDMVSGESYETILDKFSWEKSIYTLYNNIK